MNYQSLKQLCAAATVLSALAAPSQATASAPQMCGATTTTGNALTLGQNECVSGNGLYFYLDVENNNTNMIANQKLGIATPTCAPPINDVSTQVPRLDALMIPTGMAIIVDNKSA